MFQFLRLCSASRPGSSPVTKILHSLKRDGKLLLLWSSTSVKKHFIQLEKRNRFPISDKVILYEYNNDNFFNKVRFFTLANYTVWALIGYNIYDIVKAEPPIFNEERRRKWEDSANNRILVQKLIIASVILGFFLVLAIWFYFLRSVRRIELTKSTKSVKFETYSFFPSVRQFTVPLENISGVVNRHTAKNHVPIKIKNSLFYYLLDVKGQFHDGYIFDNCIGVERDLKNT